MHGLHKNTLMTVKNRIIAKIKLHYENIYKSNTSMINVDAGLQQNFVVFLTIIMNGRDDLCTL